MTWAQHLAGRVVIASVSGGKDSSALSMWLTDQGIEHRRVFADTGWEHALTYHFALTRVQALEAIRRAYPEWREAAIVAFLDAQDAKLGEAPLQRVLGPIDVARGPDTFESLVTQKTIFPSRRKFRFCSELLKFEPIKAYFATLPDDQDYVSAVGIRRDESANRANALEWEWFKDLDYEVWRPLVDWTVADVLAIHRRHNAPMNPLYSMGASRVGCWPCINANKREIALISRIDPPRINRVRALEAVAQQQQQERTDFDDERSAPTMFTLRPDGKKHIRAGVDDVVAWATNGQPEAPDPTMFDDGCMRWGMCEPPESTS